MSTSLSHLEPVPPTTRPDKPLEPVRQIRSQEDASIIEDRHSGPEGGSDYMGRVKDHGTSTSRVQVPQLHFSLTIRDGVRSSPLVWCIYWYSLNVQSLSPRRRVSYRLKSSSRPTHLFLRLFRNSPPIHPLKSLFRTALPSSICTPTCLFPVKTLPSPKSSCCVPVPPRPDLVRGTDPILVLTDLLSLV